MTLKQLGLLLYDCGSWCGSHSNKIMGVASSGYAMAAALGWTHLTPAEIGSVWLFFAALGGLFIESTTVSTKRMGERIDEVKAQAASGIVPNGGS